MMAPPFGPDNEPATRADVRRLHDKIDALNERLNDRFVHVDDMTPVHARLKAVEDWQIWFQRLIVGAIMLALIAVVLKAN